MAEEAQVSGDTSTKGTTGGGGKQEIESQIKAAMHARIDHIKNQADSFTFEAVRRLLEKDLGLETYSLDVHKRFVKQCLLQGVKVDDDETKTCVEAAVEVSSTRESPEGFGSKEDVKEPGVEGDENMEVNSEAGKKHSIENKVAPNKSTIMKALLKRASYIRLQSEKVTMAGVRRLLEEDLKLEKKTLDPYKKFITEKVDEILKRNEVSDSATKFKNGNPVKKDISSKESSDASQGESEDKEEEEVKPKKGNAPKGKIKSGGVRKHQRPAKEANIPNKKPKKSAETTTENDIDEEDGNASDYSHARSSDEKPVKKKEVSTPAYGKRVEHLRSIIKSCGMSIPPTIYKRVKQAPENKREACLLKELEEILSREGLSANPSEKEIKEVRKKKERAKELEGIDMSNIVSSTRRRSTTSLVPPPKPKIPVESSDDDDDEDTDNDDEDDNNEDEEEEENDDDNDNDDDNADSQSE